MQFCILTFSDRSKVLECFLYFVILFQDYKIQKTKRWENCIFCILAFLSRSKVPECFLYFVILIQDYKIQKTKRREKMQFCILPFLSHEIGVIGFMWDIDDSSPPTQDSRREISMPSSRHIVRHRYAMSWIQFCYLVIRPFLPHKNRCYWISVGH